MTRLFEGEIPGAHFQGYFPGRYYWCAGWALLFGPGLLGLRLSTAIFQGIGLFCGLLTLRRVNDSFLFMLYAATILTLWMFPRYRAFESSIPLIAIFLAVRLLESPTTRQHLLAGLFVGLSMCFGPNHGAYNTLAFLLVMSFGAVGMRQGLSIRKLLVWASGIMIGLLPLLLLIGVVPGFGSQLIGSITFNSARYSEIALPYPWPWNLGREYFPWYERLGLASAFVLPLATYCVGILVSIFSSRLAPVQPRIVVAAATIVGSIYLHHVAVRSDVIHLAGSIQPALVTYLALPAILQVTRSSLGRSGVWALLGLLTVPAVYSANGFPGSDNQVRFANFDRFGLRPIPLVAHEVMGDRLYLGSGSAAALGKLEQVVAQYVRPEEGMFIAQTQPALYVLFEKAAPVWGIYFLWTATPYEEQDMIEQLTSKHVEWALIFEVAIDGRQESMFRNLYPTVWEHLTRDFEPVAGDQLPEGYVLLRRLSENPF